MKKQKLTAALLSSLLITALAGAFFVNLAAAASDGYPEVVVDSPVDGAVYSVNDVRLKFHMFVPQPNSLNPQVTYFLNDKQYACSGNLDITLKDLPNGEYVLIIYAQIWYMSSFLLSEVVRFTVNTGVAPSVSIIGLQTYSTNEATLNITTDTPTVPIAYSLDGQANVTLQSNMFTQYRGRYQYNLTLSNLSDGPHTLTAYATDALGYTGVSEKAFTVKTVETQPPETQPPPTQEAEPFPFALTAAVVIVAVVSIAGLAVYFKKRKH